MLLVWSIQAIGKIDKKQNTASQLLNRPLNTVIFTNTRKGLKQLLYDKYKRRLQSLRIFTATTIHMQ